MENKNFGADIDVQAVLAQYEMERVTSAKKQKTQFDAKNYLSARLGPNEKSKSLTIRLLPFSKNGGTCFHKVMMHTVRVNPEVSQSGWKSFVCPILNELDSEEKFGDACPFCETSAKAKEMRFSAKDEASRKKYGDIEFMTKPKEMWIVRCIERGHEDDGVKFWMFTNTSKILDEIDTLTKHRIESAAKRGEKYNPLSIRDGMDLIVTLTRGDGGKTNVHVMDDNPHSALSDDENQIAEWVNDSKEWTDVYTVKPYEYMAIIASGGVPVFDKETKKYVDKTELKKAQEEKKEKEVRENIASSSDSMDKFMSVKPQTPRQVIDDDIPF